MRPHPRLLNCLYYEPQTGLWLPGSAMYRFLRVPGEHYLVYHLATPASHNLLSVEHKTCSCEQYFFSNLTQPDQPVPCRHLRLLLLLLGSMEPTTTHHSPSQPRPLAPHQVHLLQAKLNPDIHIEPIFVHELS